MLAIVISCTNRFPYILLRYNSTDGRRSSGRLKKRRGGDGSNIAFSLESEQAIRTQDLMMKMIIIWFDFISFHLNLIFRFLRFFISFLVLFDLGFGWASLIHWGLDILQCESLVIFITFMHIRVFAPARHWVTPTTTFKHVQNLSSPLWPQHTMLSVFSTPTCQDITFTPIMLSCRYFQFG